MTQERHPVGVPERSDFEAVEPLWIECYVRPHVSQAGLRRIDAIRQRLETLAETALVAGYEFSQWPPKHEPALGHADGDRTREELLAEFEQWAQQQGCTLTPAFQRRCVSPSLLGPDEARSEVRVPTVTLVLSDEGEGRGEGEGEDEDATTLRGVVPYRTDDGDTRRTYTVDDWLSSVEETVTPAIARGVRGREHTGGGRESGLGGRATRRRDREAEIGDGQSRVRSER